MSRHDRVKENLRYFEQMVSSYDKLSPEEKEDLAEWDRTKLSDTVGTSDWPGWEKHIGVAPWKQRRAE